MACRRRGRRCRRCVGGLRRCRRPIREPNPCPQSAGRRSARDPPPGRRPRQNCSTCTWSGKKEWKCTVQPHCAASMTSNVLFHEIWDRGDRGTELSEAHPRRADCAVHVVHTAGVRQVHLRAAAVRAAAGADVERGGNVGTADAGGVGGGSGADHV